MKKKRTKNYNYQAEALFRVQMMTRVWPTTGAAVDFDWNAKEASEEDESTQIIKQAIQRQQEEEAKDPRDLAIRRLEDSGRKERQSLLFIDSFKKHVEKKKIPSNLYGKTTVRLCKQIMSGHVDGHKALGLLLNAYKREKERHRMSPQKYQDKKR